MKTKGISPKVWSPAALAVVAFAAGYVGSGTFDRIEAKSVVIAVGMVIIAYFSSPGEVEATRVAQGFTANDEDQLTTHFNAPNTPMDHRPTDEVLRVSGQSGQI